MDPSRDLDLIVSLVIGAVLTAVIAFLPSFVLIRVILGLPLILLVPGYTILAVLYPRRDDMDPVERLVFSLGLSPTTVTFIGFVINFTPWGIRLESIMGATTGFILVTSMLAVYRRQCVAAKAVFSLPLGNTLQSWVQHGIKPLPLLIVLGAGVLGTLLIASSLLSSFSRQERFSEFYILGESGFLADVPREVTGRTPLLVKFTVRNHEGQDTSYRIVAKDGDKELTAEDPFLLNHGATFEGELSFTLDRSAQMQRVEFLLYRVGEEAPYRTLHLWLLVRSS